MSNQSHRNKDRRRDAKRYGYAPPPMERDCPPRPADGCCQCCFTFLPGDKPGRFHLDHDHMTGEFRGWTCSGCNTGHGIMDDPDRLRTRTDFLINRFLYGW